MRPRTGRHGWRSRWLDLRASHDVSFHAGFYMASVDQAFRWQLDRREAEKLAGNAFVDPFTILGPHDSGDGRVIRAMLPGAEAVEIIAQGGWSAPRFHDTRRGRRTV